MVLTAYSALSPVTGLSCHRRPRKLPSANLTPASARQDHTTSPSASGALRRCVLSASPAPRRPSVTSASRPSVRRDCMGCIADLGQRRSEKFFQMGLDRANHIEKLQQIRFYVQCPPQNEVSSWGR